MTRERGSRAEEKNCEILLFLTADRRFGSILPRSLARVKCPGIARGGGGVVVSFGIDWHINFPYICL